VPGQWPHTPHALGAALRQPSNPPLLAYPLALELFFNQVLKCPVIPRQLSDHGFVVEELLLKLFYPFELGGFQTDIFRTPLEKGGSAIP